MHPNSFSRRTLGYVSAAFVASIVQAQNDCLPTWSGVSYSRYTNDLLAFDAGFGEQLYATHSGRILRWDGETWTPAGTAAGSSGGLFALRRVQTQAGLRLWALGRTGIWESSGDTLVRIAQLSGVAFDLVQADLGDELITFVSSDLSVFRLDGAVWTTVGSFRRAGACINSALAAYDDGSGPAIFLGGALESIDGQPFNRIARLDPESESWSDVGGGVSGGELCGGGAMILSMVTYDDGSGPKLYVAGAFAQAGGASVGGLASWNGSSWSAVGGATEPDNVVLGLRVLDLGAGPVIVAIGEFTQIGGVSAKGVAAWDGTSWTEVGGGLGMDAPAWSAATYDDGSSAGPALFVGGEFENVNGATISGVARLDCICPDLSGDGAVGLEDLAVVLSSFGQTGSLPADLNGDGTVSLADLSILLAGFGTSCK